MSGVQRPRIPGITMKREPCSLAGTSVFATTDHAGNRKESRSKKRHCRGFGRNGGSDLNVDRHAINYAKRTNLTELKRVFAWRVRVESRYVT